MRNTLTLLNRVFSIPITRRFNFKNIVEADKARAKWLLESGRSDPRQTVASKAVRVSYANKEHLPIFLSSYHALRTLKKRSLRVAGLAHNGNMKWPSGVRKIKTRVVILVKQFPTVYANKAIVYTYFR
jgi:hypothetical protein